MTKKVTELPAATTPLAGVDILLVVQGGVSKQAPVSGLPASGGGLTNWTEAVSTAAPNATVPVTSFTATNAATNVDAALVPKGTGALLSSIPTGTSTGGNKRGARAVDLQLQRFDAAQVASGSIATIAGGEYNTASATASTVSGGSQNTASTNYSSIGGGQQNVASGTYATVSGGNNNLANGSGSSILGGFDATTRLIRGAIAYSAGMFAAQGDAQRCDYVLRRSTTNATASRLSADGTNTTDQFQITLPNNSAYAYRGKVVARHNTTGDCSAWEIYGVIKRGAAAANTSLVGTPTVSLIAQDAGAAAWVVAITADTTTGCLAVTVTGVAATNIKWVADIETVEVVG